MRRALGQVFLVDQNILRKIVEHAQISEGEWVLEVGAGKGNLTRFLLERGAKVLAYEMDLTLLKELERRFSLLLGDRLFLRRGDFLKAQLEEDLMEVGAPIPIKFISNIPYYITGLILRHIVEKRELYSMILLTLQKEVAERLVAYPNSGSKEYGFTTLLLGYYFDVRLLFTISSKCFKPVPRVSSGLVRFLPRKEPPVLVKDEELFFKIIKEAFRSRRKKLRTVLRNLMGRDLLENLELEIGKELSLDRRGETMSLSEFALVANTLKKSL